MNTLPSAGDRPPRRRLRALVCAASATVLVGALVTVAAIGATVNGAALRTAAATARPLAPAAGTSGAGAEAAAGVAAGNATTADGPETVSKTKDAAGLRGGLRTFVAPRGIRTTSDVTYATAADGSLLDLDVCSATSSDDHRPALLLIHGGGWHGGDKASVDYHAVCQWLASEGFVTFSADYTLGAAGRYPVAPRELTAAITWMRRAATVQRFGIDPTRIGFIGGSAGGSLASLLATRGTGPTDRGTRVAALVDLSGPVDLTARGQSLGQPSTGIQADVLGYLGCATFTGCAPAAEASAITHVDASDPPAFIQGSQFDFVPHEQGTAFAAALTRAGVPTVLRVVPGSAHSIAQLDASTRAAVAAFLHRYLG